MNFVSTFTDNSVVGTSPVDFCSTTPVGGTGMTIDTTALLLYGVQSSMLWWLPAVVIAGAGVGLYKVKKKIKTFQNLV